MFLTISFSKKVNHIIFIKKTFFRNGIFYAIFHFFSQIIIIIFIDIININIYYLDNKINKEKKQN